MNKEKNDEHINQISKDLVIFGTAGVILDGFFTVEQLKKIVEYQEKCQNQYITDNVRYKIETKN